MAVLVLLALAGCRQQTKPTPAGRPTVPPTPTVGPFPTLTPQPEKGGAFWPQSPCAACHGLEAGGIAGNGTALRGQNLDPAWTWQMLRGDFRFGAELPHPTFTPQMLSDQQIVDIIAWLNGQPATP